MGGYNVIDGKAGRTAAEKNKHVETVAKELKEVEAKLKADPTNKELRSLRRNLSTDHSRTQRAVDDMPGLLEYMGFILCFPGYGAGPAIEISEYLRTTNGEVDGPAGAMRAVEGSSVMPTLKNFSIAILAMAVNQALNLYVPYIPDPAKGINQTRGIFSDEFLTYSLLQKYAYCMIAVMGIRCQYYFAWKLGEGAYNAAGYGYLGKGKSGEEDWSGCNNMDILLFEWSPDVTTSSKAWNKKTQFWLQHYAHTRTKLTGLPQMMLTYLISAVWHGIEVGYYIFFLTCPFLDKLKNLCRAKIRPYFMKPDGKPGTLKPVYDFVTTLLNITAGTMCVMPFLAMGSREAVEILRRFSWLIHITLFGLIAVFTILPKPKADKPKTA